MMRTTDITRRVEILASALSGLSAEGVAEISKALTAILADLFALYMKTKNFHWHISGPHFRSYHLLFDEQAAEIYATTDELAERVRKTGGKTIHSISEITRLQSIKDNNKEFVSAAEMLQELMADTKTTIKAMRSAHEIADKNNDIATASLLENS